MALLLATGAFGFLLWLLIIIVVVAVIFALLRHF
jgi:nitrate reductase NapE component